MTDPNYFVCTLGQAALHEPSKDFRKNFTNINDFVEQQAERNGSLPAVGFYQPPKDSLVDEKWKAHVLTYREVYNGSCVTAERIAEEIQIREKSTAALLCPSSADFLLTWLALMRLGHAVLHVAPQCSPNAVAELCRQCGIDVLFYDDVYEDLARSAAEAGCGMGLKVRSQLISFVGGGTAYEICKRTPSRTIKVHSIGADDVAYLHHTSGTSTGVPKPIPQTHRVGVGVYARFDVRQHATFTTTPLYHGGIADLFRAWTSAAMIWLFPGKDLPITATNVVKCLDTAEAAKMPSVRYFSSVPYVLQMMASDETGMQKLQSMDIVGVGGAALPAEVGDDLVRHGVNLVSRFGSAECGFLMSSHRDYAKDKAWQFLRPGPGVQQLQFEQQGDGLYELVILPGWPHMSKKNREDGSFATADLFKKHESISDAWRYDSRADAQLTLITGKKFDPSPLESSIAASSKLIDDVLIFGNGKPYPGALLFRSEDGAHTTDEELLAEVAPIVERLNENSQSHARIPRNMLLPMAHSRCGLEKSSKGTILRGKAEERYADEFAGAYETVLPSSEDVPDEEVEDKIAQIVESIVAPLASKKDELTPDTDLFAYGVDSVACVQIRHAVSKLLPESGPALPITVVQDSATIGRLSTLVLRLRRGRRVSDECTDDQTRLMQDLVEQYSQLESIRGHETIDLPPTPPRSPGSETKTVLLTGPTGSLGSHILNQLLAKPEVAHIHLLLRGATEHAARERVRKALSSRKPDIPTDFDSKVSIHTCVISEPQLGLSDGTYALLARDVDIIYHLAWAVDFTLSLRGFKQHFAGLQSLLSLTLAHANSPEAGPERKPARLIFCSSTASVASFPDVNPSQTTPESIIDDPAVSGTIGYSRSKWVAEKICLRAVKAYPQLKSRISVVRVGQLSGDTVHGTWNASEAYPLMLSSAKVTACLPDLPGESIGWLPVDTAATAFVDLLSIETVRGETDENSVEVTAYHLLNPHTSTTWAMLLSWLQESIDIEIVTPRQWLESLDTLRRTTEAENRTHPCLKLLDFWQTAYGRAGDYDSATGKNLPRYRDDITQQHMPALRRVEPVDRGYVLQLWKWIEQNV